jgi:hypothetical protein
MSDEKYLEHVYEVYRTRGGSWRGASDVTMRELIARVGYCFAAAAGR